MNYENINPAHKLLSFVDLINKPNSYLTRSVQISCRCFIFVTLNLSDLQGFSFSKSEGKKSEPSEKLIWSNPHADGSIEHTSKAICSLSPVFLGYQWSDFLSCLSVISIWMSFDLVEQLCCILKLDLCTSLRFYFEMLFCSSWIKL